MKEKEAGGVVSETGSSKKPAGEAKTVEGKKSFQV